MGLIKNYSIPGFVFEPKGLFLNREWLPFQHCTNPKREIQQWLEKERERESFPTLFTQIAHCCSPNREYWEEKSPNRLFRDLSPRNITINKITAIPIHSQKLDESLVHQGYNGNCPP
ncbi:hypothetical protein CDAR_280251 [Caerostris darwini]|uniref:Ycf15 n=1 Tax=Caerostris darwini TaxID=1538125 RepID=A0AAV4SAB9_9ARAC|nr:hypothetical protein CDAR_280251 [Caerostris darwini]